MTTVQRIIKVIALCLAGGIIVSIFAGIVSLVGLMGLISGESFSEGPVATIWQEEKAEVRVLEIDTGATELRIIETDEDKIRVESNNEHIASWQDGNTLQVVEKSHFWWFDGKSEVNIYVPRNYKFEEVYINNGAGVVNIEKITAKRGKFELGAGKTEIGYIEVSESAEVEGGAGLITIKDGKLKNLDLEVGAGKAEITAEVIGNSKISSGVGRLELNLLQVVGGYKFNVDKGIGSVVIDGSNLADDATYGDGENLIKLDSGVGSVEVKMVK